jgi:DNA polymerase (family X)
LKLDREEVAGILGEIGDLLEMKGENPFKIRAYRNAARLLLGLEESLEVLIEQEKLGTLKGIGDALAEKITTLVKTGRLEYHENLRGEFPATLFDLLKVPGLGPKKVSVLYRKLNITSLGELERACRMNRLVTLEGFGLKTEAKILVGIERLKGNSGLFLFAEVIDLAESVVEAVSKWKEVKRALLAGSLRRRKEIVRDVDIVCSSGKPNVVMKRFTELQGVTEVIARGETKTSVRWENGLQFDLRVVDDLEFPYALAHFTGSKEHNTSLRTLAKGKGLKMNEYGLFRGKKRIRCKDEPAIFKAMGLAYIPPELREDQGEIELASKNRIPKLLELSDLRGVFHVHTTYSDARNSLAEMVEAASEMGLDYIGISEHSKSAYYAGGLKEADIDRQRKEIDLLQEKYPKLRIFHGIESDILPDGSLDYPGRVLEKFDFVVASVHAKFNLPEEEMTKRCLRALENPYCTMLGHPTGRLLLAREPFQIDLHALIDRAAKLGKIIELNSHPQRLDLDWRLLGYAKRKGMRISINPDAHSILGLRDIQYGVFTARKGGLGPEDVLNTLPKKKIEEYLSRA